MTDPIVIVGAGQAGVALAGKLRALGHGGPLAMIGDEPVAAYQRPPLSKKYVSGELALERLLRDRLVRYRLIVARRPGLRVS